MPPKKQANNKGGAADQSSGVAFTESDIKMINCIFKHSTSTFKVAPNWEAVRMDLESASLEATKTRFRQISQKHGWFKADETTPATPDAKKTPARSAGKKKNDAQNDENSAAADEESPAKKRKIAPKKAKAPKKQEQSEIHQDDQQEHDVLADVELDFEMAPNEI